jgi:hypothetical protein
VKGLAPEHDPGVDIQLVDGEPPGLQALLCAYGVCRAAEDHAAGCQRFTEAQVVTARAAETLRTKIAQARESR